MADPLEQFLEFNTRNKVRLLAGHLLELHLQRGGLNTQRGGSNSQMCVCVCV